MLLSRRYVTMAAVTLVLLGCDSGDEAPEVTESTSAEESTADETDDGEGDDGEDDDGGDPGEPEAGELSTGDADGRPTPQDQSLDLSGRHPGGTTIELSEITFDDVEIRVTAEMINGSSGDIDLNLTGGNALRLVDDLGSVYNFVAPDDLRDRDLALEQGESISGEFVFVGPIVRDAASLSLAVNTREENPLPSDMEDHNSSSRYPVMVVDGIDLSW